jgi:LDH2 family malate/lactate/ureidoglycolate dehydrogenase
VSAARFPAEALSAFSEAALRAAGADAPSARDATRAMLHASLHGIDSHGFRLLPHYCRAIGEGRVNGRPSPRFRSTRAGSGIVDADDGHGARGTYLAAAHAVELARASGVAAVAVVRSSHFGAAGAYALEIAREGLFGMVVCNSDAFVRLHEGAERFHGTNPIAAAAPTPGRPWLLDMATSAIPFNRVKLAQSLGLSLPEGTASDENGRDTTDPARVAMLAPLGREQGYKGAGLAGLAEVLSAVMTGMRLSPEILPMLGPDWSTRPPLPAPRRFSREWDAICRCCAAAARPKAAACSRPATGSGRKPRVESARACRSIPTRSRPCRKSPPRHRSRCRPR